MPDLGGLRALVTGGAGFIGSHLVDELLANGAERVAVVDNFFLGREANLAAAADAHGDALTVHREDAGDLAAMAAICGTLKPDIVFDLATKALLYSFFNPPGAFSTNTQIAATLGELLRTGAFPRLVHLSSSEVYGSARHARIDEDHPMLAETSYAAGKAAADLLLASYVNMFGLDIVTVRPFNNYGPRQNDGSFAALVPLTLQRLARGERPVIEGDGRQTRDFIFVNDTVRIVIQLALLGEAAGQTLNVGSGRETSIGEVVEALCGIRGYEGEIAHAPARPADVRRHCADIRRLQALTGPLALTPLSDGLRQTCAWYHQTERSQ